MKLNQRDEILALTPAWQGERFSDGRPNVPDSDLATLRTMTLEELWLPLFVRGYPFQFEGGLKALHPGKKLVGRAVTCTFVPTRPDLYNIVYDQGRAHGWQGTCNQWVVDSLVEGDVLVADLFDKIHNGTFLGGNLTTAVAAQTKTGGAVIWGGVRDIEQMQKIDVQVCYRGVDPTPIREVLMTGYNEPCRIGGAVCLPGDVVMATTSSVLFIPSHLVAELIEHAHKSHAKDLFGFRMIEQGVYNTAEIDATVWSVEMMENLEAFLREQQEYPNYQHLDWGLEQAAARGEAEAMAEMMKYHLE